MYKIFQITAEKHVYDQVQGELYNRSWADLSLFGLRPGEIHCTSVSAESVSVWLREYRQVYVWWRRGSVEQRYLGRAGTGVSRSRAGLVSGSGYSTPTHGTGYYDSQAITRMHEMSPSAFDAPHNEDLPQGSLEESDSCGQNDSQDDQDHVRRSGLAE